MCYAPKIRIFNDFIITIYIKMRNFGSSQSNLKSKTFMTEK